MKFNPVWRIALLPVFLALSGRRILADEKIIPAPVEGISSSEKYIRIPTNLQAAAQVDLLSAFVSRGQVNNDRPVVQPEVELTKYNIYLNAWGNLELTDRTTGHRDFTEVDLTAGYRLPVRQLDIRAGIIDYLYPNQASPETREVFCVFEYPHPVLSAHLEIFYDFDKADGFYTSIAFDHPFTLADGLRLTPGIYSAWGSASFNDYYYRIDKSALNDGNVYAILEYQIMDKLTVNLSATYSWLWDASIRDGASVKYRDTKQLIIGAAAVYLL